jgi:two-component sensor histidine kinase
VDRSAQRLQALIEDMLTISKIELGAFTSNLRPVDLARVVADAADMIRPLAAEKGLSFEATCPDGGLMVEGEAGQLARMLDNLLSNAVKYTPAGGSVTLAAARDGDWAVLSVADTGIGIPGPEQGSLFNRFFRASNAVDLAIPGSGLGLGIVRTIISNHHGDIGIESAEGASTTVTVRIPLRREGQAAGQDGARGTVPGTSPGGTSPGETVPGETVPGGDIARGDSARGDSARGAVAAQGAREDSAAQGAREDSAAQGAREDSALPDGAAPGMAGLAGGPGGARPERDPLLAANRRRR